MVKDRLQSFINRTIRNSFVELNGDPPVEIDFYNERPKYYDKEFQRSYILKYFYAYIIEYYEAYHTLLNLDYLKKPYKVLSIGAGSCVDYYGLVFALLEYLNVKKLSKESIFYTGIDREDWLYVKTLKNENFEFIQNDLTRMHSFDSEDYNLVIFPKSIGDFNNYQFKKLEILFRNSFFSRNKICLINSYIGNNKEKERFNKIIDQMEHVHNYKCIDDKEDYSCYWDDEITIADTQKIIYPKEVLRKLEAYKRMPMLRAKYANTQIVRLEKK